MSIRNIWQNSFYNSPPVPKWSWEADFSNLLSSYTVHRLNLMSSLYSLNEAIVSCSWGKREMSVVNTFFGGIQANFPGRVQNSGELTIKFNENINMQVSKALEQIFDILSNNQDYFDDDKSNYTFINYSIDELKGNSITIKIKKPSSTIETEAESENDVIARLRFYNVFPIRVNEEELSYESTEEVLTKTVTFSYDYMKYDSGSEDFETSMLKAAEAFDEMMKKMKEEENKEQAAAEVSAEKTEQQKQDTITRALADAFIRGDYGNGQERILRALKAGFTQEQIDAAQALVNERMESGDTQAQFASGDELKALRGEELTPLKGSIPPPETDEEKAAEQKAADEKAAAEASINGPSRTEWLADQMIGGKLGNGKDRKKNSADLGFSDEEIKEAQGIVNERAKAKDWKMKYGDISEPPLEKPQEIRENIPEGYNPDHVDEHIQQVMDEQRESTLEEAQKTRQDQDLKGNMSPPSEEQMVQDAQQKLNYSKGEDRVNELHEKEHAREITGQWLEDDQDYSRSNYTIEAAKREETVEKNSEKTTADWRRDVNAPEDPFAEDLPDLPEEDEKPKIQPPVEQAKPATQPSQPSQPQQSSDEGTVDFNGMTYNYRKISNGQWSYTATGNGRPQSGTLTSTGNPTFLEALKENYEMSKEFEEVRKWKR